MSELTDVQILHGRVAWFHARKGFGAIIADDGRTYFAHHSNIASDEAYKMLSENDSVTFTDGGYVSGKPNPLAKNIKRQSVHTEAEEKVEQGSKQ